jgi:hypothetical protein
MAASRIVPCRNRVRRQRDHRGEGGGDRDDGHEQLGVVAVLARHERLDEHPDDRRAHDDQGGRQLTVLDLGGVDLRDRVGRSGRVCPQAVDG